MPIDQWGEKTAAAFLGVRLECAQCHKHPFDRWTQADYRAFANLFASINSQNNQFSSPDAKKVVDAENAERDAKKPPPKNNNQRVSIREMFLGRTTPASMLTHPDTNAS